MRFSHISLFAVVLVAVAVALAGCTGSSPAAPSGGGTQSAGSPSSGSSSSGASGSSAAAVSGTDLFGGLNYNWVEYRIDAGSGMEGMTIYYKYNKQTGKCTMRFEGAAAAQIPAGMQEMDCSPQGGSQESAGDPNQVSSDVKVDCSLLDETVTVPAGTFSATKCTATSQGSTSTSWIAKGKFVVKTEAKSDGGSMSMVLNAYG